MHRRILVSAKLSLALLLTLPYVASAQTAPAASSDTGGAPTGASAPVNAGGGGRGGFGTGGRRGGGGGGGFGTGGTGGFGTGGRRGGGGFGTGGGRRGGGGAFGPAAVAGPAGSGGGANTIQSTIIPAGGGAPVNPAGPGAIGPGGFGPGGNNPGNFQAVTGETPNPDDTVELEMSGSGAQEVLDWLQLISGKIILKSGGLPTVSITFSTHAGTNNVLPRKVVIDEIMSLLAMNGIMITPLDGTTFDTAHTLKAETFNNTSISMGVPFADDTILDGPPSELVYTHIFPIHNITADDAAFHLTNFFSHNADTVVLPKDNSLEVSDTLVNLQQVAKALKIIDTPVSSQNEITIRPMHNAQAATVVTTLQSLQTGILSEYFGNVPPPANTPTTMFAADPRTNSVIVVTNKSNHDIVNSLLDQFDADQATNTHTQVFNLRQALAQPIQQLLQTIVTGVQGAATRAGGGGGGAAAAGAVNAQRDGQFSQYVTIAADSRSNSIVAYGTPSDLQQIGDLIGNLDVILPQVRIEAVITEVTLTKNETTGLSAFNINYGYTPPAANTTTGSISGAPGTKNYGASVGNAFNVQGVLTNWNLDAVFSTAKSNSNVVVLSNPMVTVTHAQQATVTDGEDYPYINAVQSTLTSVSTTPTLSSTVLLHPVYTQLTVTPFIGRDGSISMNISQNISDLEGNVDVGGNPTPVFGNRTVTSYVTLHDGDVLVLGGMRQRKVSNTHGVLFLLGEIPIVGQLFQPDETDTTTSELLIFIRPTIIKSTSNIDGMMNEIAKNSEANAIAQRYIRNPDLESAGVVIQNQSTQMGAKADAAHQTSTPDPAPTPPPSATLMPAATSSATEPPAPTSAPAPMSATTPAPTPPSSSSPAEGSSQPNPVIQGFNK